MVGYHFIIIFILTRPFSVNGVEMCFKLYTDTYMYFPYCKNQLIKEPVTDTADIEDLKKVRQQVEGLRHELAERNQVLFNLQKRRNGQNGVESTTGRVIEQLQSEIDNLRKELIESKA